MSGGVLFWVQHLLGSGHLRRIAAIARATAAMGVPTVIASGGLPLSHLDTGAARLVQLPPLRASDAGFRSLVDREGRPVDAALMAQRLSLLKDLLAEMAPAVVVTETFPFGRRSLRGEALALLDAAASLARPPLIVASVRDILQREARPDRIAAMIEIAQERYDAVLVHGDPALVRLEESFPAASLLGERVMHTGYVATEAAHDPGSAGRGEVIVSVGGGLVGRRLLDIAVAARPFSAAAGQCTWRLLVGDGRLPLASVDGGEGVVIEPNRADFADLLANCAVSVSQAGYNTVTDLLVACAHTVLVPFAENGETEQTDRARRLAERGLAVVVEEDGLDPESLAGAIDRALTLEPPAPGVFDLAGAENSARLLAGWARHG